MLPPPPPPPPTEVSTGCVLLEKLPNSRMTAHLHSFVLLFNHLWNQLPHSLQSHSSLQVFKTAVNHNLRSSPIQKRKKAYTAIPPNFPVFPPWSFLLHTCVLCILFLSFPYWSVKCASSYRASTVYTKDNLLDKKRRHYRKCYRCTQNVTTLHQYYQPCLLSSLCTSIDGT